MLIQNVILFLNGSIWFERNMLLMSLLKVGIFGFGATSNLRKPEPTSLKYWIPEATFQILTYKRKKIEIKIIQILKT